MKTWKLVSGIISIVLFTFVIFQSFLAGTYNTLTQNGQVSGSAGVIVAIILLSGGIVSIATRKGGKGGNIALIILYGLGALIGYTCAGSYKDLLVWASWCLICTALAVVSLVKATKEATSLVSSTTQSAPITAESVQYTARSQAYERSWLDKIDPFLPMIYIVWFCGIAAGTFFLLSLIFK